jgi:alcohol dehydrogenase (cytochrome c)
MTTLIASNSTRSLLAPRYRLSGLVSVCCLLLSSLSLGACQVSTKRPETRAVKAKSPENWESYFGNDSAWSYSSLNQINRANVKKLVPVWTFPTGEVSGGLQSTPIVVNGVMYLLGPRNRLFAMNAATGKEIWRYFYALPHTPPPLGNISTRGMAFANGVLYFGTYDNHVVAVDAQTGKEKWNVAVNSDVDPAFQCKCTIRAAPLIVKDKVIVGVSEIAPRGYLNAFDAETGKLDWRFWVIPGPGEPGNETWQGDSWKKGGGRPWGTGSYDSELNLLYWGTGDPTPLSGENRLGDNLYTDSLLAINPDTGLLKWYFQENPHDHYDYDSNGESVLVDGVVSQKHRRLLIHPSKNGYAYVIDRETGEFVSYFAYVDDVSWTKGLDKNGRPVDPVIPAPGKETSYCPSAAGGRSYMHSAYSPRTGLWYNSGWEFCNVLKVDDSGERASWKYSPAPNGTYWGHIDAFDPLKGTKKWEYRTDYLNLSSLLATAGDLLFGGDALGNVFALDAASGTKLWHFNTGGGITGATISYSVDGRQYVAVGSGSGSVDAVLMPMWFPELKDHLPQPASTLFVFALPEKSK